MHEDLPDFLKSIDTHALTAIVGQDQRDPAFEIADWAIERLSDKGITNPKGLFVVHGHGRGRDGGSPRPWSVVLKVLTDPGQAGDLSHLWLWNRELLATQSGLLADLPGPVAAPRFYSADEREGRGWLWMEHIVAKREGRWTVEDYTFAAEQAGRFNAAYLTGRMLPAHPWLCRNHARGWVEPVDLQSAWASEHVQRILAPARPRIEQLAAERERLYGAPNGLPQVFSHFDYMRRNLIIRAHPSGPDEVVAVDWAFCGIGAVGGEMATMVGSSALLLELEPSGWRDVEAAALDAYVAGLRVCGSEVSRDQVRLGYAAWMALWCGVGMPAPLAWWVQPEYQPVISRAFGCTLDDFLAHEAALCEFSLDLADEARQLMRKLGMG